MRLVAAIMLLLIQAAAAQAAGQRYKPMPSISYEEYERLANQLIKDPPYLTLQRVPERYKMGRCLLVVKARTLISGRCAYQIREGGGFEMHGPRQVYAGVDYPEPEAFFMRISTDYFVQVDHELLDGGEEGPGWDVFWNEDKRATHAQSHLGTMVRQGACYSNAQTKICLWKQ